MQFEEYQLKTFDTELNKRTNLKWLPWIGRNYDRTKTVILGESQYEDGDEWQENNKEATRTLIEKQFTGSSNKLYSNTEKVLLDDPNPTVEQKIYLWESVIYFNLVQRLMSSRKERPNDNDFDNGWALFLELIEIFKPSCCIVLGKSSCGRLGYYLNNNETSWTRNVPEFYKLDKIINLSNNGHQLKIIFINHPSGSFGFDYKHWAELINSNEPELRQKLLINK